MKRLNWIALFIIGIIAPASLLYGQGTVFTYQGQLKDAGAAANGGYDMTFRLFDSDMAGTQSGADYPLAAVPVADGLFTVNLDFGPAVFTGEPLWLEIEVNTTVLAPRQAITGTPYAQKATNAQSCNVADYALGPWTTSGADLYYNGGNIGIGTSTPTARLEVAGTPGVNGIKFPDGTLQKTAVIGGGGSIWSLNGTNAYYNAGKVGIGRNDPPDPLSFSNTTGDKIALYGDTGGTYGFGIQGGLLQVHSNNSSADIALGYGPSTAFTERMRVRGNGNVGIGTTAPLSKLDIAATGAGAELLRLSTERPWIFRQIYTGPSTGLQLYSTSGSKNFEITTVTGVNVATFVTEDANPRVGIGTTAPLARLHLAGNMKIDGQNTLEFGAGIAKEASAGKIGYQAFGSFDSLDIVGAGTTGSNRKINFWNEGGAAFKGNISVNGTTSTKLLQITGADLAEKFPTSGEKVAPGTVMEIDPENPGLLRKASGAYNQRVAGVVSGANDFPAGAILGHLPGCEDAPPIALSGRVWTYCDASVAPIAPGDLLTTSATPGHAMKALDRERSHGSIIGKAMSGLSHGERGLVLVLVNLQ